MSTATIHLDNIEKRVILPDGSSLEILTGLNFTASAGEVVAIIGRSGSGKSTLLNLLGLLDTPTSGEVHVAGHPTSTMSDRARASVRFTTIGFVFQQFHLLSRRSALGNVAEALVYGSNHDLDTRHDRAAAALERVGLKDRLYSMPHLLSGGEQQRVAIARAMVTDPPIILADEPTGALDVDTGELVLSLLVELARSRNITLIIVTHDPEIARRADRVVQLENGSLQEISL